MKNTGTAVHQNVFCDSSLDLRYQNKNKLKPFLKQPSGSPGLVVMGGDSRSKGRGFESRRQILDGHDIFHIDLL